MSKILKSAIAVVSFCFCFIFNSSATDVYPYVVNVAVYAPDQGKQFYVYGNDGHWYVITRDRVGSLAYDQYFSLCEASTAPQSRKIWIGYDTTGLGAAKVGNTFNPIGVVYGLAIYPPGY